MLGSFTIKMTREILYQKAYGWRDICDTLQTCAIEAINDYRLKHLVEIFGHSDSLLEA
jgi:hypothetical protein